MTDSKTPEPLQQLRDLLPNYRTVCEDWSASPGSDALLDRVNATEELIEAALCVMESQLRDYQRVLAENAALREDKALLEAENAALREDKARLDWLEGRDGAIEEYGIGDYRHYWGRFFPPLREVIDAARSGGEG